MSAFLVALSTWLHALATVVMIGHYVFITLVYLPILERQVQGTALRELLESISGRLRPYFGGSLLIFIITGTHLMLINRNYAGLGDFFANSWSLWMSIKHVLVILFLALAISSERVILAKLSDENPGALQQFRLMLYANLVLGMLILLLTTLAQAV